VQLLPDDPAFWGWSFDEMAAHDIPNMVHHITKETGAAQISYIGHSQGTTIGLASFSSRPDVAAKINLFVAMAPVASLRGTDDLLIKTFQDVQNEASWAAKLGSHEVLPHSRLSVFLSAGSSMFKSTIFKAMHKFGFGSHLNGDSFFI
jgi:pimeloyl-ACP methyl ester carboxylesterase